MASDLSSERAARNEAVFRNANERIEERLEELSEVNGRSPFLCECHDPGCAEVIRLSRQEYEAVRAEPRRFVIAPGHGSGSARVIERREGYHVVEKHGREGAIAEDLDPRG